MGERVARETQDRGLTDARGRGRIVWFLVGSLVLHLPFTPLAGLVGLLTLLRMPDKPPPEERLNAIPISLLSPEEMAALGASPSEPPAPKPAEPAAAPEAEGAPEAPE